MAVLGAGGLCTAWYDWISSCTDSVGCFLAQCQRFPEFINASFLVINGMFCTSVCFGKKPCKYSKREGVIFINAFVKCRKQKQAAPHCIVGVAQTQLF